MVIDGLTEAGWNETNDTDMKREWVVDRQIAGDEFHNGLYGVAGNRLKIVPGAAPFTIKASVLSMKTGGFRPLVMTVRSQLLDTQGTVLDEISLELKETGGKREWGLFRRRLGRRRTTRAPMSPSTSSGAGVDATSGGAFSRLQSQRACHTCQQRSCDLRRSETAARLRHWPDRRR